MNESEVICNDVIDTSRSDLTTDIEVCRNQVFNFQCIVGGEIFIYIELTR